MSETSFRRWQEWAAIATVVGLPVALLGLLLGAVTFWSQLQHLEGRLTRLELRISYPLSGDTVGVTTLVAGTTPYNDRKLYVVVTPVKTGDTFVQEGPLKASTTGVWSGRATIGASGTGEGHFILRAIATKQSLAEGPLPDLPPDAMLSEPVTVTRK
jgi:hypothetical protein